MLSRWLLVTKELVEQWKQAPDFYRAAAAWAYQVPEEQITKKQRNEAKVFLFGHVYGTTFSRKENKQ